MRQYTRVNTVTVPTTSMYQYAITNHVLHANVH